MSNNCFAFIITDYSRRSCDILDHKTISHNDDITTVGADTKV